MKTKKNILLVDDSVVDTMINETIVSSMGLFNDIQKAADGEQALKVFNQIHSGKTEIPDIVLLDLNMPVMDGFGFIQAFQSLSFPRKEDVIIVVVTSSTSNSDIKQAQNLGVKYYLSKPLTEAGVMSVIKQEYCNSSECN